MSQEIGFQSVLRKARKPCAGCVPQINDHLFAGRYSPTWPDGTKHTKCVYAHTREKIWMYVKFRPNVTSCQAIARGSGVTRHTADK